MRRVLVVDDEPNILKVVTKRLEVAGFATSVAMDGQTALRKACEEPPDLIILDLMLPALNGYEVCTRLKQDPRTRQIPVIIFTAKAGEADYWKGMAGGADAYLTKPFASDVLEQLVTRLIETLAAKPSSPQKDDHAQL